MKYVCIEVESGKIEREDFTVGDFYEAMSLDIRSLDSDISKPAHDMSPMQALSLVNKWNRESQGTHIYYLEENPAWL